MLGVSLGRVGSIGSTRRTGVSYLSEASALFARFATPPTTARKALINDWFKAAALIHPKLDAFGIMAAETAQAGQQNWLANQYNLTPVGAPTFTVDRGYQGDGASSYLRTSFNPAVAPSPKFTQNSASLGFWSRTNLASSAQDMGNANSVILPRGSADEALYRLNNGGAASGTGNGGSTSSVGYFAAIRPDAANENLRRNTTQLATNPRASQAPANSEFILLARNNASGTITPSAFSTRQMAMWFIGGGLTNGESDGLYAATLTYLQAIGAA